ncbi:hypothetical protein BH630_05630 [Streptococcus pneumoniae]|nr:hypothetical protein BH614_05870 [Streptococcus pneumoniae WU2] [Streptococcus pneumoniae]OKQ28076.1 hypothetical protein BH617_04140 [Streptococcus pneumoniae]OKQ45575.1 hypothetical protein BH626_02365 [Streptococcus pneumoniae]OKQ46233.1 hypothetical protein BH611_10445 [Streptococcus pneumoniae]OKQ55235.1 hypothetical protein BH630_05630 [Streptococcus pneumoniae]
MAIDYFYTLRKSLQTTSASPCRTQVLPTASFLVCSLIFIEYYFLKLEYWAVFHFQWQVYL